MASDSPRPQHPAAASEQPRPTMTRDSVTGAWSWTPPAGDLASRAPAPSSSTGSQGPWRAASGQPASQHSRRFMGAGQADGQSEQQAARSKIRRRSLIVATSIAGLLAAGLTVAVVSHNNSTDEEDPDYAAVCADPSTGQRVDDSMCQASGAHYDSSGNYGGVGTHPFFWYFVGRSSAVPPIGGLMPSHATTTLPNNATIRSGFSSPGGVVQRGGFGSGGTRGYVGTGSKSGSVSGGSRGGRSGSIGG